jgi:hypothetical protein
MTLGKPTDTIDGAFVRKPSNCFPEQEDAEWRVDLLSRSAADPLALSPDVRLRVQSRRSSLSWSPIPFGHKLDPAGIVFCRRRCPLNSR